MVFTFQLLVSFTAHTAHMYRAFATVNFAQHNVKREGEKSEKWMHNAIIDLAEMEMRDRESGGERRVSLH